ncbi:MAG: hypothetical protein IGS03_12605 [Candidatus Sericytochromatia bacterium]|nr:hypothetical protein [Candidatus Sericytochromatia bacterium]
MSQARDYYGLELEILESDKLSARIQKLRHKGQPLENMDALERKAETLCQRLSYLEDPLRLVEKDAAREAVMLRSESPQNTPEGLLYYELLLSVSGWSELQRVHFIRHTNDKEAADFVLSERLLERLGQDFEQWDIQAKKQLI